jgi:hypothetical protein
LLIDDAGGLIIGDQVDDVEPQQPSATVLSDQQGSVTHVLNSEHQGSGLLKKIATD